MSATELLIERNNEKQKGHRPLAFAPTLKTIVLTCSDHRVNPSDVFGIEPGEAIVIRNAGGRVTPAVIQDLAILSTVAAIENIGSDFEFVVMHHTDCGTSRLGDVRYQDLLAGHFGVAPEEVPKRHVTDPDAAVQVDVKLLRNNPLIPDTIPITGMVYEVETGEARVVVSPA